MGFFDLDSVPEGSSGTDSKVPGIETAPAPSTGGLADRSLSFSRTKADWRTAASSQCHGRTGRSTRDEQTGSCSGQPDWKCGNTGVGLWPSQDRPGRAGGRGLAEGEAGPRVTASPGAFCGSWAGRSGLLAGVWMSGGVPAQNVKFFAASVPFPWALLL